MHVAIIMDGNGRWATRRGLPRVAGHRAGIAAVHRVVERALDLGISRLTLYAFSSDNWRTPAAEVEGIFWLLRAFLRFEAERMKERGARLRVIGRRNRLSELVLREIEYAESITAEGRRLDLYIAIDYSSREAIARAAACIAANSGSGVALSPDGWRFFLTAALGADVDLLIRTGGEKRVSDFLLWESAYAELLFSDTMWPDFDGDDLDAAIQEFEGRERRFGGSPVAQMPSVGGAR